MVEICLSIKRFELDVLIKVMKINDIWTILDDKML